MKLDETPFIYEQAVELQNRLRQKITLKGWEGYPELIGGTDLSYNKEEEIFYAGIVILYFRTLEVIEKEFFIGKVTFPYIPGLLSFRELPPLFETFKKIKNRPDVVMVDGHGYAHPRNMGLATHLGMVLDIPTIGVAKKKLVGNYEEPGHKKGDSSPLFHEGKQIGYVLRTKENIKPVFVSPGYKINFEWSLKITLKSVNSYKIPEPTRQAHLFVNEIRRKFKHS